MNGAAAHIHAREERCFPLAATQLGSTTPRRPGAVHTPGASCARCCTSSGCRIARAQRGIAILVSASDRSGMAIGIGWPVHAKRGFSCSAWQASTHFHGTSTMPRWRGAPAHIGAARKQEVTGVRWQHKNNQGFCASGSWQSATNQSKRERKREQTHFQRWRPAPRPPVCCSAQCSSGCQNSGTSQAAPSRRSS
eukprot:SAG22_NODE_6019_length_915_cov_1.073529_1_plen_194_part_00